VRPDSKSDPLPGSCLRLALAIMICACRCFLLSFISRCSCCNCLEALLLETFSAFLRGVIVCSRHPRARGRSASAAAARRQRGQMWILLFGRDRESQYVIGYTIVGIAIWLRLFDCTGGGRPVTRCSRGGRDSRVGLGVTCLLIRHCSGGCGSCENHRANLAATWWWLPAFGRLSAAVSIRVGWRTIGDVPRT